MYPQSGRSSHLLLRNNLQCPPKISAPAISLPWERLNDPNKPNEGTWEKADAYVHKLFYRSLFLHLLFHMAALQNGPSTRPCPMIISPFLHFPKPQCRASVTWFDMIFPETEQGAYPTWHINWQPSPKGDPEVISTPHKAISPVLPRMPLSNFYLPSVLCNFSFGTEI